MSGKREGQPPRIVSTSQSQGTIGLNAPNDFPHVHYLTKRPTESCGDRMTNLKRPRSNLEKENFASTGKGLSDFKTLDLIQDGQHAAKVEIFKENIVEEEDLFGDDDFFDEAFDSVLQNLDETEEALQPESKRFTRLLVLAVSTTKTGNSAEKILQALETGGQNEFSIILRDDWVHSTVQVGDHVHVIGKIDFVQRRVIIDCQENLLILHPDTLISGTIVADSFNCLRRSILSDRIKNPYDRNPTLLYGTLIHELFQAALARNNFSKDYLESEIPVLLLKHLEDLYCVDQNEMAAEAHLREVIPNLQAWSRKFMQEYPQVDAKVIEHRGDGKNTSLCINKVLDIEENVWSPAYGLKGKIDATVQVKIHQNGRKRSAVTPLEMKTGKSIQNTSHRAQTALYTLLMSDRYELDVNFGLLFYSRTGDLIHVRALRDEIRGLVMGRNELATFLANGTTLPPMIRNLHTCQRCFSLDSCLIYHKAVESGTTESSGLGSLFDTKTAHLSKNHREFFEKWERLVTAEERGMYSSRQEIWNLSSKERQLLGRSLSNVVISEKLEPIHTKKMGGYRYRFVRAKNDFSGPSFIQTQISDGDPIVVSTENGHFALAIGFVQCIDEESIVVSVDRELKGPPKRLKGFDANDFQDHRAIVEVKSRFIHGQEQLRQKCENVYGEPVDPVQEQISYRIDKDEMTTGMNSIRFNLLSLFVANNGDVKRRNLVVDLKAPVFEEWWKNNESPSACIAQDMIQDRSLNPDQRRAVQKVLSAQDYALVLGMPGTGKTTTIGFLVQCLIKLGKSILITSYTHSAVDNILMKLKESNIGFFRLGNADKVHPEIQPYLPGASEKIQTVAQLEESYNSAQIVATTCLGVTHPLFTKRRFDYCIVDEASQITLPVCLGPLRFADVFVLVGDHYQLPPVVRNLSARSEGLAESLFKRLSENHPNSVVCLEYQYRMNSDIMAISNKLIYGQRLKCGTDSVALRKLPVVFETQATPWLNDVVDPNKSVVFFDTDPVPALETRNGDLVQNPMESKLVEMATKTLISCGIKEKDIGIISPYRAQLKIIQNRLILHPNVEIFTVDRFQGRDKECVIFSLVRSNANKKVGDLLRDWRRLNVAFTRARSKMIIFGSRSTLESTTFFQEFFELIDEQKWQSKTAFSDVL